MIDSHTEEYLKKLKDIRLSDTGRARMRAELESFADFHAVRVAEMDRSIKQVQKISVFTLFINSQKRIMKATLLIALLLGAGGTSFAAQATVPGDFLYPVKTQVNDNVRSMFAVGTTAQAKLQAGLLAERLNEAQKLAAQGKLKGQVASDVQTHIRVQAEKTLALSAQTDAATQASISATVSDALANFDSTVKSDAAASTQTEVDANANYAANVDADLQGLVKVTGDTNMHTNTTVDVSPFITEAQTRLAALQTNIKAVASTSADAQAKFDANVKQAADAIAEASVSLKSGATATANEQINAAQSLMDSIESTLNAGANVQESEKVQNAATGSSLKGSTQIESDNSSGNDAAFGTQTRSNASAQTAVDDSVNTVQSDIQSSANATGNLGL